MIGERIKEVRKALGINQTDFAARLGSVQNTITGYETGRRVPSNQVIASICREFRVNEEWLRTGAGEMFVPSPASIVDELAEEYHLCPEAQAMVEKFITLDPEAQLAVFDYMCAVVDELRGREPDREERLRDELERQLAKEKKGTEKSEA
jgi:transcriptional regulator with XRE-family HTH domain